jgi:CheY-like chemotaxis protein
VDDLLDVSRITTGRLVLRPERTELGGVVQSALDTVGPMIESRGHKLILDLPDRPIYLQGDPTRLAQVFSNLLNNAVKYTEPGGDISLAMSATGAEAVIRVKDNGIGIPADMLPAIFEMFMQVDRSLERLHAGLGVGLTLARRLVELHGGTLEARSGGLGKGSEFIVRLPLSLSLEPAPVTPQEPEAQVSGAQRRVLVADDNQDHAESLAMILRSMGNEVVVAHDGLEAAAAAASFRPDFAFLDIGMPGLNGYELARRLRQSTATVGAVLVAVTGWGQEKDKRLAHEAGFNHHLVKPVDFKQIQRILVTASLP